MRRRLTIAVIAALALALAASLGYAAAATKYQVTGPVTDLSGGNITVDKKGSPWEIALGDVSAAGIQKGDTVTVYYRMTATKIEKKK